MAPTRALLTHCFASGSFTFFNNFDLAARFVEQLSVGAAKSTEVSRRAVAVEYELDIQQRLSTASVAAFIRDLRMLSTTLDITVRIMEITVNMVTTVTMQEDLKEQRSSMVGMEC